MDKKEFLNFLSTYDVTQLNQLDYLKCEYALCNEQFEETVTFLRSCCSNEEMEFWADKMQEIDDKFSDWYQLWLAYEGYGKPTETGKSYEKVSQSYDHTDQHEITEN